MLVFTEEKKTDRPRCFDTLPDKTLSQKIFDNKISFQHLDCIYLPIRHNSQYGL